MAVPKLDLKAIWEAGQHFGDWLKACEAPQRDEMERIYKDVVLSPEDAHTLHDIQRNVHILAISEAWCGDVRRHTPVVARMCAAGANLHLRVVDKETKPELMARFLTNAAEAIPVFVFLNHQFVEVGFWGPRPACCKDWMARGKACGDIDAARAKIKAFYAEDRHRTTVAELRKLFETAAAEKV